MIKLGNILDLAGIKAVLIMSHCYRRDVAVGGVRYTLHIYCLRLLHSVPNSHEPNVLPILVTFGITEKRCARTSTPIRHWTYGPLPSLVRTS